jgi:hypothetical protein
VKTPAYIAKIYETLLLYRVSAFTAVVLTYFVLALGFPAIAFKIIRDLDTEGRLSLLGILVPLSIAICTYNFRGVRAQKEKEALVDNIYEFMESLALELTELYKRVVVFAAETFSVSSDEDPESNVLSTRFHDLYPPTFSAGLIEIIKSQNFLSTENKAFRVTITRLVIRLEHLKKLCDRAADTCKALEAPHCRALGEVVRAAVEKEKPFHTGMIEPSPLEFSAVHDVFNSLIRLRRATHKTIHTILVAVEDYMMEYMPAGKSNKNSQLVDQYMKMMAEKDCPAPLQLIRFQLVHEVNQYRDRLRREKVKALIKIKPTIVTSLTTTPAKKASAKKAA